MSQPERFRDTGAYLAEFLDELLVELPPDSPEWAAVRDRLSRAGYTLPDA